jgi:hypothetical protein
MLTFLTQVNKKTFHHTFYEIPRVNYDPDELPSTLRPFRLNDPDVTIFSGTLEVNLSPQTRQMRSFKTAHPGKVELGEGLNIAPFSNHWVCVKQVYEKRSNGNGIRQVRGRHNLDVLTVECNLLRWGSILLNLTYQFVLWEIKTRGEPAQPIPVLRFMWTMIAIVQDMSMEKAFLVEEWIDADDHKHPFTKYINN